MKNKKSKNNFKNDVCTGKPDTSSKDINDIDEEDDDGFSPCPPFGMDNPFLGQYMKNNDEETIWQFLEPMSKPPHGKTLHREYEINQILSCLIGLDKPNCLLVGPAGCGKTRLVEELAYRLAHNTTANQNIPRQLEGYQVYCLNLSSLIAGCSLVGQIESRVKLLLDVVSKPDSKTILFIDEAHLLFGSDAYKKIAQILKPALARGSFRCICATTITEVQLFSSDPAFSRRLTQVNISEPSKEETAQILLSMRNTFEKHYGISFQLDKQMARMIVDTADELVRNGNCHRPDNALTLMDRTLATLMLEPASENCVAITPESLRIAALRLATGRQNIHTFTSDDLNKAFSAVRGQDKTVNDIKRVMELERLHLRPRSTPLSMLFVGNSGSGKSMIAELISTTCYDEKPIVLNMAEFSSETSVNKLIGVTMGFVGCDSFAELPFDKLSANPYQVIVLDHFEEAHSEVKKLFMRVLSEGFLANAKGKEWDFRKSLIILTSSVCCATQSAIGFVSHEQSSGLPGINIQQLSQHFDISLLNRIEHLYSFNSISKEDYRQIVRDKISSEYSQLMQRLPQDVCDRCLNPDSLEAEIQKMVNNTYDPLLGVRVSVINRFINERLLCVI